MKVKRGNRGFQFIENRTYLDDDNHWPNTRLVQCSSCIGEYPDAFEKPGSSFLWFGEHQHLDREQVSELVELLENWLKTGSLGESE